MERVDIGFVGFAFEGYPHDLMLKRIIDAKEALISSDFSVVSYDKSVLFSKDVSPAIEALKEKEFDCLVICVSSWNETPNMVAVIKEFSNVPLLVWGLGGYTENKKILQAPASGAATGALIPALKQMDIKFKWIQEIPDKSMSLDKIGDFIKVAKAIKDIEHSKIGSLGYDDMGLYTLMFDGVSLRKVIGFEVETFDIYEIAKAVDVISDKDVLPLVEEWKKEWTFESEVEDKNLIKLAKLYKAFKAKVDDRGYCALTIKCIYGLTTVYGFTPCMIMSLLGDEIDCACECDVLGVATQTIMKKLTGQVTTFQEIYEYFDDGILMGVCGFAPFGICESCKMVNQFESGGFFDGLQNSTPLKKGVYTLARLGYKGEKYFMHVILSEAVDPGKWQESSLTEAKYGYPSAKFVLKSSSIEDFKKNILGQHYHITAGDIRDKLKDYCYFKGIDYIE